MKSGTNNMPCLYGAGEPSIVMLKGTQWGTEGTRRTFLGARWEFAANGAFIFFSPATADLRDDLFPLPGTYERVGDVLYLRGEKFGEYGASTSLDGTIKLEAGRFVLRVLYTVASGAAEKIAEIVQPLAPASQQSPDAATHEVAGVRVPNAYRVTLHGATEAGPFGPLEGRLKLAPPCEGDPNPLWISLSTDAVSVNGALLWSSFTPTAYGQSQLNFDVRVVSGKAHLTVIRGLRERVGLTWFTEAGGIFGGVVLGATAESGELVFAFPDAHSVTGRLKGMGTSDGGQPSTYEAVFTGRKQ